MDFPWAKSSWVSESIQMKPLRPFSGYGVCFDDGDMNWLGLPWLDDQTIRCWASFRWTERAFHRILPGKHVKFGNHKMWLSSVVRGFFNVCSCFLRSMREKNEPVEILSWICSSKTPPDLLTFTNVLYTCGRHQALLHHHSKWLFHTKKTSDT